MQLIELRVYAADLVDPISTFESYYRNAQCTAATRTGSSVPSLPLSFARRRTPARLRSGGIAVVIECVRA